MKEDIKKLNERILEISIKYRLSHLGSCFTTLPILYEIFQKKGERDGIVLSNGHAGIAYYVALEHFYGIDAEMLFNKWGLHPERDLENLIEVSTGSLGMGLPIAVGMAMANPKRKIHCIISDGETYEGSIWESLTFIDETKLSNIEVYVNINGWTAYKNTDTKRLSEKLKAFMPQINLRYSDVNNVIQFETPLSAHYLTADESMKIKE